MDYKLVAIDCDNTLINDDGFIPEKNIKAINMIINKGIKVVIATGRNDILVKEYMDELGVKEEIVIGCNGASIRDLSNYEIIQLNYIPKPAIKKIIDICLKENIKACAYNLDEFYSIIEELDETILKALRSHYKKVLNTDLIYKFESDVYKLAQNKDFLKIVIIENDYEKLLKIKNLFASIPDLTPVISAKNCLDITKKNVSKGNALLDYASILGIKKEEILAIGDSENDLEMLKLAGLSVAMGNANNFIKHNCDMITSTNNDGGVADAIYKIFENNL